MKAFELKRYYAIALDPIHIGTGGYRIGRVDNTIVREPATGIPKIPGTTIEGVCRSYAFLKAMEEGKSINPVCAKGKVKSESEQPCGKCEICVTFGFSRKDRSMQAMALFSDTRILFFPVATMIGPVWVTCPMVLKDAGIKEIKGSSKEDIPEPNDNTFIVPESSKINPPEEKLNFGWLLLTQDKDNSKKTDTSKWVYYENSKQEMLKDKIPDEILSRIVIVPDNLFSTIVNSNLEVRTSVAIDPERGAAEEGALFTYEAIPRGTVFWFDVTYQNPKHFGLNDWETNLIIKTVEDGLRYFEFLGVGGMGSRGFGRLEVIGNFLPFEEYIDALERRLETLQKETKKEEIEKICEYLRGVKSKMEKDVKDIQSLIDKVNKIFPKFCR